MPEARADARVRRLEGQPVADANARQPPGSHDAAQDRAVAAAARRVGGSQRLSYIDLALSSHQHHQQLFFIILKTFIFRGRRKKTKRSERTTTSLFVQILLFN